MNTMHRVREAIDPAHQAIEQTEFSKSLMDGRITRAAYSQYLTQMWHIHYQLEHHLPNCATVAKYFAHDMIRTPAIERDLFMLGSAVELQARMPQTLRIEERLQAWSRSAPFALLGCCYILEGSRMGSLVIGRALIKHLHLQLGTDGADTAGVEYHLQNAAETPRRVKQLKNAIDEGGLSADQEQELTVGACTFMNMLNDLYEQLPVHPPAAQQSSGQVANCPMHALMHQANLKSA